MRLPPLLLALSLGPLASCAELPGIEAQGCGNRLVEPGTEDCDGPTSGGTCGEPGQAGACRFVCDRASPSARGGCPAGFTCGLDKVCRQPSGGFAEARATLQVPAEKLLAGDLDADGRADLLALARSSGRGASPARVVYFGDGAVADSIVVVPGQLARPTLLPLPGGAPGAIVSATFTGLSALLVQDDRSLLPRTYPSLPLEASVRSIRGVAIDVLPATFDGDVQRLGDEIFLALQIELPSGNSTQLKNIFAHTDGATISELFELPSAPDKLSSGLPHGHLLQPKSPTHPCPSIALAPDGSTTLSLLTPCVTDDNGVARWQDKDKARTDIPLDGSTINGPTFVVDANRDGLLDVVVGVSKGDDQLLMVAYGTGQGHLVPTPGSTAHNRFGPLWLPPLAPDQIAADKPPVWPPVSGGNFPLAMGHFDQDKLPDFVLTYGVMISSNPYGAPDFGGQPDPEVPAEGEPKEHSYHMVPFDRTWSEAKLCDLNADGLIDIVATSSGESTLDVLLGKGDGRFSNSSIALEGPPGVLETGDFDGDLIDDVVFRERIYDTDGELDDELVVLFGARQGVPSEIVRMGRFGEINQLAPGRLTRPGSVDLATDLGLFSRSGTELIASQLFGSSDRRLRSSFPLQVQTKVDNEAAFEIDQPEAVALARLSAGASPGLVAVGVRQQVNTGAIPVDGGSTGTGSTDSGAGSSDGGSSGLGGQSESSVRLWRLDVEDEASIAEARSTKITGQSFFDGVMAAGDLDGDGVDEVILLQNGDPGDTNPGSGPPETASATPSSIASVFKLDASGTYQQSSKESFKVGISLDSEARLADLDGDGLAELILLNIDPNSRPVQTLPGSGGAPTGDDEEISGSGSLFVVRQASQGGLDWANPRRLALPQEHRRVRGFCLLGALAGAGSRLAVLTERRLFVAAPKGDTFDLSSPADVPGGRAVACADFNGDGIDDLAASSGDSVRILLGLPRLP